MRLRNWLTSMRDRRRLMTKHTVERNVSRSHIQSAEVLEDRLLLASDMLVAARDFGDHVAGSFYGDGFYTWLIDSDLDGHTEIDRLFGIAGSGNRHQLVAADWDNDGDDDLGAVAVQRHTDGVDYLFWYQDSDGDPGSEPATPYLFGRPGDKPVTGDFNRSGGGDRGIARSTGGNLVWFFDTSPSTTNGNAEGTITFGPAGATPVTGDWNNDGYTDIGYVTTVGNNLVWTLRAIGAGFSTVFDYPAITYGPKGATPITGNWDSNPADNLAWVEVSGNDLLWKLDNDGNYNDSPEIVQRYGLKTDVIVVGNFRYPEVQVFSGSTQLFDNESFPSSISQVVDFGPVEVNSSAPHRTFSIRNTGNVSLATIATANGRVQYPSGYSLTNGATASIAPGGSDNITLRLNTGQLGTFSGFVTIHNNDGNEPAFNFRVTGRVVDTTPPSISNLNVQSVSTNSTSHSFSVTYNDVVAVNQATINNSDMFVTGPNGYVKNATLTSKQVSNGGRTVVATYTVGAAGPNGRWDSRDNGSYTIKLRSGEVTDSSGNALGNVTVGAFIVAAPDNVAPTVSSVNAGNVSRRGGNRYDFTVTYEDFSGIDVSTIDDNDISVVSSDGDIILARRVAVSSSADGSPRVATYRITPPGSIWEPADNDTYTIRVRSNSVRDVNGNAVAAGVVGSFLVNARDLDTPVNAVAIAESKGFQQWYFNLDHDTDFEMDRLFGLASDVHLVSGNWDGRGGDDPGVVRPETLENDNSGVQFLRWYLDTDGDPSAEIEAVIFGLADHTPVTGDWDGNGITDRGAVDEVGGKLRWYFDTIASTTNGDPEDPFNLGALHFDFGPAGATPVTGDWDGNGVTDIGYVLENGAGLDWYLYSVATDFTYPVLTYGLSGSIGGKPRDTPVVGDWNNDGADNLGVVSIDGNRDGVADLHLNGQDIQMTWLLDHTGAGAAENSFQFGLYGHEFLSGRWIYSETQFSIDGGPELFQDGTVNVGTKSRGEANAQQTLRVTNTGNDTLKLSVLNVSPSFRVSSLDIELGPGETDTFLVELVDNTIGDYSGVITLGTNDGDENPFRINVTGQVAGPVPGVFALPNGGTFDFDVIQTAIAAEHPFTLRNDGDRDLVLSNLSATGDFSVVEGLTNRLTPGAVDTFTIKMRTTGDTGNRTGTVSFTTNDPLNSTYTFSLQGRTADLPLVNYAGVIRPTAGKPEQWFLDLDRDPSREIDFDYGLTGDTYFVGDWISNGIAEDFPGAVREIGGELVWLLGTDSDSDDELRFRFGQAGDLVQVGDFNNDGRDDPAFLRLEPDGNGNQVYRWYIFEGALPATGSDLGPVLSATRSNIVYGFEGDLPVVGDWNGNGFDQVGVVSQFLATDGPNLSSQGLLQWFLQGEPEVYEYGRPFPSLKLTPVIGDWDGNGTDDMGIVEESTSPQDGELLTWYLDTNRDPHVNFQFDYGFPGDIPVAGIWKLPEVSISGPSGVIFDNDPGSTIDFGTVRRGDTGRTRQLTVQNTGTVDLEFRVKAPVHGNFGVRPASALASGVTIAPRDTFTFSVDLFDTTGGPLSGTFQFLTNDGNESPFELLVEGRVEGPIAGVAAASNGSTIDLGQVNQDVKLERRFTVFNFGTEPLIITQDVTASEGFYVVEGLGSVIAPGEFDEITIGMLTDEFTVDDENQPAPRTGTISFATNDPKSSLYRINLTGQVTVLNVSDLGAFDTGRWFLDVDRDPTAELDIPYGLPGDIPVSGNWIGTDHDDIGVVRADSNGDLQWYLNLDDDVFAEIIVQFGRVGDIPVVGDWNGDGQDDLGVARRGATQWQWLLDLNRDSTADLIYSFGDVVDATGSETLPFVGKWLRDDPQDHLAIVRKIPGDRLFHWEFDTDWQPDVDYSFTYGDHTFGARLVVGDWNGDAVDDVAAVQHDVSGNDPLLTWFLGFNTGNSVLPEVDPHSDIEVRYGFLEHTLITGQWTPARRRPEIDGTVWIDTNDNKTLDGSESGIAGVVVYIDANFNGVHDEAIEQSTVTDQDGNYRFSNLLPGAHPVAIKTPEALDSVFPGPGTQVSEGFYAGIFNQTADLAQELLLDLTPNGTGEQKFAGPIDNSTANGVSGRELINLPALQNDRRFRDVDGAGYAVVVIDTGLDVDHPAFGPDLDGDGIADRIVYQQDFFGSDNDASDADGHGTNVTGILAGQDIGVVPGANIIHLKVFPDEAGGQTSQRALEKALQWVVGNAGVYDILAVNMSLGADSFTTPQSGEALGDEFAAIAELGIITVAAGGNSYRPGQSAGIAYPAADPNVISVGAVYVDDAGQSTINWAGGATDSHSGSDVVAGFTQRDLALLDVFAPGVYIEGPGLNGGQTVKSGSSQAAPYVTGAAVVAQQIALERIGRRLSVDEFRNLLRDTGQDIRDDDDERSNVTSVSGGSHPSGSDGTIPRLDILALAQGVLDLALDNAYVANVALSDVRSDANFGLRYRPTNVDNQIGIISGSVFDDVNQNGQQDNNEAGEEGRRVHIFSEQLQVGRTLTTDENGDFHGGKLPLGPYEVSLEEVPLGQQTSPIDREFRGTNMETRGLHPAAIADADFNNDGRPDLIVANLRDGNGNAFGHSIDVFLNSTEENRPPSFEYASSLSLPLGLHTPVALAVADVPNSGSSLIAVGVEGNNQAGLGAIVIYRSTGDEFEVVHQLTGVQTSSLKAEDLDGDGHVDFAFTNLFNNHVTVLWNDGLEGGFTSQRVDAVPSQQDITVGHLDDDGRADLIVSSSLGEVAIILSEAGEPRGFDAPKRVSGLKSKLATVTTGDLDKDGDLDIIVGRRTSTANIVVIQNAGDQGFDVLPALTLSSSNSDGTAKLSGLDVEDVDSDGRADIVATLTNSSSLNVLFNKPVESGIEFRAGVTFDAAGLAQNAISAGITFADFDSDEELDIATANLLGVDQHGIVSIFENRQSEGSFGLTLTASNPERQASFGTIVAAPDTTPPTATISPVSPDPRETPVGTVTINFDEAVTGVSIDDLRLTRNGSTVSLESIALETFSTEQYTVDLSAVTALPGDYVLRLLSSSSGIRDEADNLLATDSSEAWTYHGITVLLAQDGNLHVTERSSADLPIQLSIFSNGDDLVIADAGRSVASNAGTNDSRNAVRIPNSSISGGQIVVDMGASNDLLDARALSGLKLIVFGGAGNDSIFGGSFNDQLSGELGDDLIDGGAGDDTLDGGVGEDELRITADEHLRIGSDSSFGDGTDLFDNFERAVLVAGPKNNRLDASSAEIPVALWGGDGGDTLVASNTSDQLYGGDGIDFAEITGDNIVLTDGSTPALNSIEGLLLTANRAGSLIDASSYSLGPVTIIGSRGNDTLKGGGGNDFILAGAGADSVTGGAGNDLIIGGRGNDTLEGNQGDDTVIAGGGHDIVVGGEGADRLHGGRGHDTLHGSEGVDRLHGGVGRDLLNGDEGADYLVGGAGRDDLAGGAGDDVLNGASRADDYSQQVGRDILYGGARPPVAARPDAPKPPAETPELATSPRTTSNEPSSIDGQFAPDLLPKLLDI